MITESRPIEAFSRANDAIAAASRQAFDGDDLHTILLPSEGGDGAAGSHLEPLTIRLADCDRHRSRASTLLNRMYAGRGYGSGHQLPKASNSVTFTATLHEDVVGTLTLTVNSEAGLAIDRTFDAEIEPFRNAPGAKLCELTKFAFDASCPSKPRLAALFHIIFIYGSAKFDCTDLFIEVNPRHRRFYEAMLGFKAIGEARTNASVQAPAQLMWLNVANIRELIDRHVAKGDASARSLYRHFLSPEEERRIYRRLSPSMHEPRFSGEAMRASMRG